MNTFIAAACLLVVTFPVLAGEPLTTKADNLEGITLPGNDPTVTTTWLSAGTQLSNTIPGMVELSPEAKLARAFALCARFLPTYVVGESCNAITEAWRATAEKTGGQRAMQQRSDRAFIEEVARGLK